MLRASDAERDPQAGPSGAENPERRKRLGPPVTGGGRPVGGASVGRSKVLRIPAAT